MFAVTLTGSKITVARSSSNSVSKRSTDPDYIIFKNGEEHRFPGEYRHVVTTELHPHSCYKTIVILGRAINVLY